MTFVVVGLLVIVALLGLCFVALCRVLINDRRRAVLYAQELARNGRRSSPDAQAPKPEKPAQHRIWNAMIIYVDKDNGDVAYCGVDEAVPEDSYVVAVVDLGSGSTPKLEQVTLLQPELWPRHLPTSHSGLAFGTLFIERGVGYDGLWFTSLKEAVDYLVATHMLLASN